MPERRKPNEDFHFVDVHVGKVLRLRREQLGISRQRLAQAAGVVHQQVEKYENAINRVSPGCLYRFVPVAYFFEDLVCAAAPVPPTPIDTMVLPDDVFRLRDTKDLVKAYYAITYSGRRRAVHQLIRSMRGTS